MGVLLTLGVPGFEFEGQQLKKMFFPIVMKLTITGHPTARTPF